MRIVLLLLLCVLAWPSEMRGQRNFEEFQNEVIKQYSVLSKKEDARIKKVMRKGYESYQFLKSDSLRTVPVYSIYQHKHFRKQERNKEDLFVVLNPKSLTIDEILFFNGNNLKYIVPLGHTGLKKQLVYRASGIDAKLADLINQTHPQIIFKINEWTDTYFVLENWELFGYKFDNKLDKYIKISPQKYIDELDDFSFSNIYYKPLPKTIGY